MTTDTTAPAGAHHETLATADPAPAPGAGAPLWQRAAIGVPLFLLAVVLPLLRQTGVRSWETIWAEDGAVYYADVQQHGAIDVLFRGYAAYLQLPPRLLALGLEVVPAEQFALYLAVSSALVTALLAWFVYRMTDGWVGNLAVRLALGAMVVLMPALGYENIATITNTIWVFVAVAPWAIVSLVESRRAVVARGVVLFLAATASALSVLFFPLAIGWALVRRTRAAYAVCGAYLFGIGVQAFVVLRTTDHARPEEFNSVRSLGSLIAGRVFGTFGLGTWGFERLWVDHRNLVYLSALAVIGLLVVCAVGAARRVQALAVTFVAYAVITFAFPVWGRGTSTMILDAEHLAIGLRYSVLPVLCIASAFAVLVAGPGRTGALLIGRIGPPLFVAQTVFVMVLGFPVDNPRSLGPTWQQSIDATVAATCPTVPADQPVNVPISPPAWSIAVPCAELTGSG